MAVAVVRKISEVCIRDFYVEWLGERAIQNPHWSNKYDGVGPTNDPWLQNRQHFRLSMYSYFCHLSTPRGSQEATQRLQYCIGFRGRWILLATRETWDWSGGLSLVVSQMEIGNSAMRRGESSSKMEKYSPSCGTDTENFRMEGRSLWKGD